jgi:ABC-type Zn uptake system ZnuABC Zn-binding protein ZnuA
MDKQIGEIVKEYADEINNVLSEYEDAKHQVSKDVLSKLLKKLTVSDQEIEHLIAKISLHSSDIKHLNYKYIAEIFGEE